jgi:hypothetical protein
VGSDATTPGGRVQGEQNGIFKLKKFDFLHSTSLKLLSQLNGNLINDDDSSKLIIFSSGGHCDYLLQVPKNLDMPLLSIMKL